MTLSNEFYLEKEDFRFGMLVDELAKTNIPTTEAEYLHRWLSGEASERLQQLAILNAIGVSKVSALIEY